MNSKEIRARFKSYFERNGHKIVPSSSMIVKGDPTLMFTNAGMNQFKDIFLGIRKPESLRVADSQKCLRVSGKHNDLEDVGHDTYHHTMFEMLGNWSFGDYFKEDAIRLAWNLLTEEYGIDKNRLYVTVFGGDPKENLDIDHEAENFWMKYVPKERIIYGSKKDNFWEMGDQGPCGPCSEIHIDLRDDDERAKVAGAELVNKDNPQVIEIWNLVFIQYNRKADGTLEPLPQKHIDTGMGFERLCAVLQGKKSNYDTDIFQTIIGEISKISGKKYGVDNKTDIALRVVADHLRAVSFAIADGQLPSNNKAGYVIRRILRRAVRYAYSFLDIKTPFMYKLVDTLVDLMGDSFPELVSQKTLVEKVINEEETVFLRTLERGLRLLDTEMEKLKSEGKTEISGVQAFLLYDTYGFPLDLTELIAREKGYTVNKPDFDAEMAKQKERARNAAEVNTDDWVILDEADCEFTGYDSLKENASILRYRKVVQKNETLYHIVFDRSPFYAEKGGQVGDKGVIVDGEKRIPIINTIEEHNLRIHVTKEMPQNIDRNFEIIVDTARRTEITNNHTATHLLHYALRSVLGTHVEQKGSMVNDERLRFDFAHFNKMTAEEIRQTEIIVNGLIRQNIVKEENRSANIEEAKAMGAMALFGEKYGKVVRVIKFGDSIELCGGTHVASTGQIGFFKIISESAIAAGVRRIEAITGVAAQEYIFKQIDTLSEISAKFNNAKNLVGGIDTMMNENSMLKKQVEAYKLEELKSLKKSLVEKAENRNGTTFICTRIDGHNGNDIKEICTQLRGELNNFACIVGSVCDDKPALAIALSDNLVKDKGLNAGNLVRESAKLMQGGGGGQPFMATAGGKDTSKIDDAISFAKAEIEKVL